MRESAAQATRAELARQQQFLRELDSLGDLERWPDVVVRSAVLLNASDAIEVGPEGHAARLAEHFQVSRDLLEASVERMRRRGVLRPEADPTALTAALMASLLGGHLLARVTGDVEPVRTALNMAVTHVRTFASRGPGIGPDQTYDAR